MEAAKKAFEQERDKILSEIPEDVKAMYGQIGFAVHETIDAIVPVLVLSPYSAPPKPIRDIYWFDMYSKAKRSKALADMSYLIYWYGSDDPGDCYSFIEQGDFISFEAGMEQGQGELPPEIQEKVDSGAPMDEDEQFRHRAIQELLEDIPKAPAERRRGVLDFKEKYEQMGQKDPPKKKAQKTKH